RYLRDRPVVLRHMLERTKDDPQEVGGGLRGIGPAPCGRQAKLPQVSNERHLKVQCFVRLLEVGGEERGHRELDDFFESSLEPADRLHQVLRRRTTGSHGRTDLGRHFLPKVSDVLEGRRGNSVPEQMSRFRDTDLGRDRPIRCREGELADDEPVETVHLNLHASNVLGGPKRPPRRRAASGLLPPRRSDPPRTRRHVHGACRRPRSTCSQQIRAESRSIPPTASEGRRRDSNSRASVPSDYLAPCYQYVSSAVNKYVVYTISREYP